MRSSGCKDGVSGGPAAGRRRPRAMFVEPSVAGRSPRRDRAFQGPSAILDSDTAPTPPMLAPVAASSRGVARPGAVYGSLDDGSGDGRPRLSDCKPVRARWRVLTRPAVQPYVVCAASARRCLGPPDTAGLGAASRPRRADNFSTHANYRLPTETSFFLEETELKESHVVHSSAPACHSVSQLAAPLPLPSGLVALVPFAGPIRNVRGVCRAPCALMDDKSQRLGSHRPKL